MSLTTITNNTTAASTNTTTMAAAQVELRLQQHHPALSLRLRASPAAQTDPTTPAAAPSSPAAPAVQATPAAPGVQPTQVTPAAPGDQATPAAPGVQATPAVPGVQATPAASGVQATPASPEVQAIPAAPGVQAAPAAPGVQAIPAAPGVQSTPASPGVQAIPAAPGVQETPAALARRFSFVWPFISKDHPSAAGPDLRSKCTQLIRQFPAFISTHSDPTSVRDTISRVLVRLKRVWLLLAVYAALLLLAGLSSAVCYALWLSTKPPGLCFLLACACTTSAILLKSTSFVALPVQVQQPAHAAAPLH